MHFQLGMLIEQQHHEQVTATLSAKQQKKQVLSSFISKKSSEVVLERHRARHALEATRLEQKILDEVATTSVRHSGQRHC
ncbi:Flagellar FliJ protein [compost metagenome]